MTVRSTFNSTVYDQPDGVVPVGVAASLDALMKILPCSLNLRHLLVHCAWQAAYLSNVSSWV